MKLLFPDGTLYTPAPAAGLRERFTVPDDGGKYALLRHDWQWGGDGSWNYKPRSAGLNDTNPNIELPETVHLLPLDKRDFLPLSRALQDYHLALLRAVNPSVSDTALIQQWKNLTGQSVAFTDRHAWNSGDVLSPPDPSKNFALYAAGLNLENPPIAWKVGISCGGNLVKIVEAPNVVEAVDWLNPLPIADLLAKPWLLHWGTVECGGTNDKFEWSMSIDGALRRAWRVIPFPQVRNVDGKKVGTPYPLWGSGGRTRVETSRLLPIAGGAEFSPYVLR